MNRRNLLLLGSSLQFVPLIKKAQQLGAWVIVCDGNENTPGKLIADEVWDIDINNVEAICARAYKQNVNSIFTGFSDILLKQYAVIAQKLSLKCYIKPEKVNQITDKVNLRRLCTTFAIPQVNYQIAQRDNWQTCLRHMQFPLILKPHICFGGRGMYVVKNQQKACHYLESYFVQNTNQNDAVIIEEFCEGAELSATCLIYDGIPYFTHINDRVLWFGFEGRPGQTYSNRFPSIYQYQYNSSIYEIANKIIKALQMQEGILTLQLLVDSKGEVKLIEPLARLAAGADYKVCEYLCNFDFAEYILSYAMNLPLDIESLQAAKAPPKNCAFFMPLVFAPGTVSKICGLERLNEFPFVKAIDFFIKEGDTIPDNQDMRQVMGRIYATAETHFQMLIYEKQIKDTISVLDQHGCEMIINDTPLAFAENNKK